MKKFPKVPLLLSILLLVFSCLAFWFLYTKVNNNNKNAESAMTVWQTEANRRNDIKTLDNSIQDINQERAQLETHFAQSFDVVPFLNSIEALALPVGAKAQVSSVEIPDSTGLLVGLSVSGSFESIYKFITLLENFPYELDFISMDLQKQTVGWEGIFKIKLLTFEQ